MSRLCPASNLCPASKLCPASNLCPDCAIDESSHSFKLLYHVDGINVFYSCPSSATKYEIDGILKHFTLLLDHYNCSRSYWKLIFDFNEFGIKHALEINVAIGIARLINNYSKYLTEIRIINTNIYTYSMMRIVMPFLNNIKIII